MLISARSYVRRTECCERDHARSVNGGQQAGTQQWNSACVGELRDALFPGNKQVEASTASLALQPSVRHGAKHRGMPEGRCCNITEVMNAR